MRLNCLLFALLFLTFSTAQDKMYLNTDARLYKDATTNSTILGYFKTNAKVEIVIRYTKGWFLVKADNNDTGYVNNTFLSKKHTYNTTESLDIDNPILSRDKYYGSHHLFVLVANLRARNKPTTNSEIKAILTTGKAVAVKYVPVNIDHWVCISNSRFVQRKFLGERPDFNVLKKTFNGFEYEDITNRKRIAERLVQLAWNGGKENLVDAYNLYYDVAKQLKDSVLINEIETKLILVKGLASTKTYQEREAFIENTDYLIEGINVKKHFVKLSDVTKIYGAPTKIDLLTDECGVFYSETFYTYPNMVLSVNKEENLANIVTLFINAKNSLKISDHHIITHHTTERYFITKYAHYVFAGINQPHVYSIHTDSGGYNFTFKNGKIVSVDFYNLC
ncbi:SH3 domain-containing protein [Lacinutrix sp. Bg11-31]|uniref:SH3 domain-containing protein n=1 Tax=Lacinutrix sp. Bg11-31 TaxID=2057808 RepID=UPI000C2FFDF9|nr:SH3 domain-containing protein [Lacinutrix sp. Bg11-31]AUC81248.1 SH3 domain-containing protein [Lacinutrix sp. Bg11-31]